MLRNIASTLAWVDRAIFLVLRLGLYGAVVFGLGSIALGANGAAFILGSLDNTATAVTRLTGTVAGGAALQISNPSTATSSHALQLSVPNGKSPLVVANPNAGKAFNLNADKLDGKDAPLWAVVDESGFLVRAFGATSSTRTNSGQYTVVFNKPVNNCAYDATIGGVDNFSTLSGGSTIQVKSGSENVNSVNLLALDGFGNLADYGFHLVVNC